MPFLGVKELRHEKFRGQWDFTLLITYSIAAIGFGTISSGFCLVRPFLDLKFNCEFRPLSWGRLDLNTAPMILYYLLGNRQT